ncbi:MAG: hypothetical protein PHQ40_11035 [Anaerolineaceae bacterium]|nr:hypothetical protein [Anaerolineaceae bacterium]
MKQRTLLAIVFAIALSVMVAGEALASGSFYTYNLTVPRIGGSAVTNNMQKVNASDTATICSEQIGGGYTLYARFEDVNNSVVAASQSITALQRRNYTLNPSVAEKNYHARISTSLLTTVNVQAIGQWSPDNPGNCSF